MKQSLIITLIVAAIIIAVAYSKYTESFSIDGAPPNPNFFDNYANSPYLRSHRCTDECVHRHSGETTPSVDVMCDKMCGADENPQKYARDLQASLEDGMTHATGF